MARKSLKNQDNTEKKKPDDNEEIKDNLNESTGENSVLIPIVLSKNPYVKKMTIAKQKEFLGHLIAEWNVSKAAHKIGINRRSIYEFIKNNSSFKNAFEEIKESHLDDIECNLVNEGKTRNFTPGIFLLKSHRRSVYGDKVEMDVTQQINVESTSEIKAILSRILPLDVNEISDAKFSDISDKVKNDEGSQKDREEPE